MDLAMKRSASLAVATPVDHGGESDLELAIVAVCRELCGLERLGATDQLFDRGLHSLLLPTLAARLESLTGVEVPIEQFFLRPNARALALYVASLKDPGARVARRSGAGPDPSTKVPKGRIIDLSIGEHPWRVGATLTVPEHSSPCPAAVLVPGSGALDRDSTVRGVSPFRDIAEGLAARGIATIRFDKRSFAHDWRPGAAEGTVENEIVVDALAAAAALRDFSDEVREDAVFVLGHSLGALVTPDIVSRVPSAAGMVLLAPAARWTPLTIVEQLRRRSGLSPERLSALEEVAREIVAGRVDPGRSFVEIPVGYMMDIMRRDPIARVRESRLPALLLRGEADQQIGAEHHAAWVAELAGQRGFEAEVMPGLDHFFTSDDALTNDAASVRVHPSVLSRIADFILGTMMKRDARERAGLEGG